MPSESDISILSPQVAAFNLAPVSFVVLSAKFEIVAANTRAQNDLKMAPSSPTRIHFPSLVAQEHQTKIVTFLNDLPLSAAPMNCAVLMQVPGEELFEFDIAATKAPEGGQIYLVLDKFTSRRSEMETAFFQEMVSKTFDGIHLIRVSDQRFVYVNSGTERMFGYEPGELLGKHVSIINAPGETSPEETARIIQDELFERGTWVGDIQNRRKDGTHFWCHARVTPFDHHQFGKVWVSVHEDIDTRKKAEQELHESRTQLRALLARLNQAQEEERIRISRDIHDELGQLLTTLRMETHRLERKLSDPNLPPHLNPLIDHAVDISALADKTLNVVQKIAHGLRPIALDQLGLEAALLEKARRFEGNTGVKCRLTSKGIGTLILPPDVATQIFYICREALTNVARHAQATHVEIRLHRTGDYLHLELQDNGIGISQPPTKAGRSLGILGMKERALLIDATIQIEPTSSRGTLVSMRVPLNQTASSIRGATK